jgi:hypothetical protein
MVEQAQVSIMQIIENLVLITIAGLAFILVFEVFTKL